MESDSDDCDCLYDGSVNTDQEGFMGSNSGDYNTLYDQDSCSLDNPRFLSFMNDLFGSLVICMQYNRKNCLEILLSDFGHLINKINNFRETQEIISLLSTLLKKSPNIQDFLSGYFAVSNNKSEINWLCILS